VHGKVGRRIDGRGIHWVSGWSGERYSVVYSSTDLTHVVRAAQADHNESMVAANNKSNSKQC
jgi:hypothetical protein